MLDELSQKFDAVFKKLKRHGKLTEKNISDTMREIRRVLLEADVNFKIAKQFTEDVKAKSLGQEVTKSITPAQQVIKYIHDELVHLMGNKSVSIEYSPLPPTIIMVIGLQGSGKTTFVGKLGHYLRKKGKYPLLVAADIYRPAAIKQLQILGDSLEIPVYTENSDDVISICKSSILQARKRGLDMVIFDTAGRLHIDDEMMEELKYISKETNPREVLLVADAMTGQDAVNMAKIFNECLDISGIVLNKLDGDTKGGAALSISHITGKPIKFIGVGEKLDALEIFHPERMASRILGMGDIVSLVEKAHETVEAKNTEKFEKKLRKGQFTLDDYLDQLQGIKKMGSLEEIMSMIPGINKYKDLHVDDRALIQIEAIINSTNHEERQKPHLINGSRRKRISRGSGTKVSDVNRLLKQFSQMQKMMKKINRFGNEGIPTMNFFQH